MDVESLPGEFKQTSLVLMSAPCVGGLLCSASRPLRGGLGVGGQGRGGGEGGGGGGGGEHEQIMWARRQYVFA